MKKIFILLTIVTISLSSLAQGNINRSDWMMGGDVGFESRAVNSGLTSSKQTETSFRLSPNVGYFFIDQLAGGIRMVIQTQNYKYGTDDKNKLVYTLGGPFLRYYFLPSSQKLNIFLDGSYTIGSYKFITGNDTQKYKSVAYAFNAGAAYFLSPAVAVEFALGYQSRKDTDEDINSYTEKDKTFGFSIGFQIHLPGSKTKTPNK